MQSPYHQTKLHWKFWEEMEAMWHVAALLMGSWYSSFGRSWLFRCRRLGWVTRRFPLPVVGCWHFEENLWLSLMFEKRQRKFTNPREICSSATDNDNVQKRHEMSCLIWDMLVMTKLWRTFGESMPCCLLFRASCLFWQIGRSWLVVSVVRRRR